MFKLCIFAAILAVALAAPATEEAKPAKRSAAYSVPLVGAPAYVPYTAPYTAPLTYSNYVAPASVYPYYGGYYPYAAHPVTSPYYGAYPSPLYY